MAPTRHSQPPCRRTAVITHIRLLYLQLHEQLEWVTSTRGTIQEEEQEQEQELEQELYRFDNHG